MPDLKPHLSPTKLILAFDIGTTYSSVSYCILEPHQDLRILSVTKFPAQGVGRTGVRVPSLLYYDKTGIVRAAGAEVLAAQDVIGTALTEGWTKAECWKLHLRPKSSNHNDLPPLPAGKSAVDILTDFIKYLFGYFKTYFLECHPEFTWSSVEPFTQYIFTYPGGWDQQQHLYFQAVERAGLVDCVPDRPLRIHMVTEGEAALHFCVPRFLSGKTTNQAAPQRVVIIDAGGGIISLSMFSVTSKPISCEAIAPAESRLQGSIFVTRRARALIERKLDGWEHFNADGITRLTHEFDRTTKLVVKSDREAIYINVVGRRIDYSKYGISSGQLKLSGEEATGLFNDSIDTITGVFEKQLQSAATPVTMVFLVGGLSMNEWVWSRLQSYFTAKKIRVRRPDGYINKVVANGAVSLCADHESHPSRLAFTAHGVAFAPCVDVIDTECIRRKIRSSLGHLDSQTDICCDDRSISRKFARCRYDVIERELWRTKAEKEDLEKSIEGLCADLRAYEQKDNCETLYAEGRIQDAAESLMNLDALDKSVRTHKLVVDWITGFRQRCVEKLNNLGDSALESQNFSKAVEHFSTVLALNPPNRIEVLLKRARVRMSMSLWGEALNDVDEVIALDLSSPWGYEMKHAILHQVGDYYGAVDAFEMMFLKMVESPDRDVQKYCDQYISPSSIRAEIRKIIQRIVNRSPRVLINTTTGHLHDRAERASAFEYLPVFNELVSSMTKRIDYVRIKHNVRQHFRYVMLSHRWEDNEPLFQQVVDITVHDLGKSPTHDKLQMFCRIVRDAEFTWAWSDTCCVNKSDHFILQEALVAMFKWYQGSAMVIVFLRGVRSSSLRGALVRSIWNTRAWTLQEYIASRVIRFYTEDWTPYLGLGLSNHKQSPVVIAEMEEATGLSAQQLRALRPGLTGIQEKLRLASTRQTTLVEDAAYSLLGIFSVTSIPAIYGEEEDSLGRLLAHILAGSGHTSILGWTGESGNFNSSLPAHITVFKGSATSHTPSRLSNNEVERIIATSYTPSFELQADTALRLYDCLSGLPPPWFAAKRMKLPCIAFKLPSLTSYRTCPGCLYRSETVEFGTVEIQTRYDLSRMTTLYLVHPWLDTVLGRGDVEDCAVLEDNSSNAGVDKTLDEAMDNGTLSEPELLSLPSPIRTAPSMDRETHARRLAARLRQPFGALLVTLASEGRPGMDYRRIATDSLITVRFQDNVSLADILDNVHTLDVL